jgi:hypothetical protein
MCKDKQWLLHCKPGHCINASFCHLHGGETMAGTRQIGFLVAASPDNWDKYIKWFKAKLQALGHHDFNITFLPPAGAAGDANKTKEAATYLAGNVEVIVTAGTQAALACKAATQANQTPFVLRR